MTPAIAPDALPQLCETLRHGALEEDQRYGPAMEEAADTIESQAYTIAAMRAATGAEDAAITDPLLLPPFGHTRSCPSLTPGNDEDCTCGLTWRIQLATRITLHEAWIKRATEAERENAALRKWLDNNTTFYNVSEAFEAPVLAAVSGRIWYHATDDMESYPFSDVIRTALASAPSAAKGE